jgi:hypothetical protein
VEIGLPDPQKGGPIRPEAAAPLPSRNMATLGKAVRVGDLEVTPRIITRRPVSLVRLDGTRRGTRRVQGALVLRLEFMNLSPDRSFSPIDLAFVRDSSLADDQSFIETSDGRRISMYRLATESEWSIWEQTFPRLNPGESAETIVVSVPVERKDLTGTLTWHVKLRTSTYQTDVLGVRFTARDLE